MADFKLEEITDVSHPLLQQAITLIKTRLKPGQTPDASEFAKAIANKKKWAPDSYHLLIITTGNELAAAEAGYYIADINAGFINYIVVDPKYENKGLAKMMRESLIQEFVRDAQRNKFDSPVGYLGEVEQTNPWLKKLIRGFGAIPMPVPYVQPPLKPKQKPVPLVLYLQPHPGSNINVDKAFVENVVRAVYQNVYDIKRPHKKSYFKKILEALK